MNNSVQEELLKTMEIITQAQTSATYDRTEICTVISQNTDFPNEYWVTNGTIKYTACTLDEDKKYAKDSKVYVTIPQGNYENRKIILGSYTEIQKADAKLLEGAFENLVVYYEQSINEQLSIDIDKTGNEISSELEPLEVNFDNNSTYGGITHIGVDLSITTEFGGTKGKFWVDIEFLGENTDNTIATIRCNSTQIIGNPYYLLDIFSNKYVFALPNTIDLTQIKSIKITLTADNQFNYTSENNPKITVNNLKIYYGYDTTNSFLNKRVRINTENLDLNYTDENNNEKNLIVEWYDSNNNKIYNQNHLPTDEEFEIYWFRYLVGEEGSLPDIAGNYWVSEWESTANDANAYSFSFTPDRNLFREQIKVGVKSENSYYESDVVTFTKIGEDIVSSYTETIKLSLDPGDDGVYNNYGIDNKLLGSGEVHYVTANFIGDNLNWPEIAERLKVTWKVPLPEYTLIKVGEEWVDGKDGYLHYTPKDSSNQMTFQLNRQFSFNKTNSTILCEVEEYETAEKEMLVQTHYGSIQLRFGTQGTSGSNFAFNIYPDRKGGIIDPGIIENGEADDISITLQAELETSEGEKLEIQEDTIQWFYQVGNTLTEIQGATDSSYIINCATICGWHEYYEKDDKEYEFRNTIIAAKTIIVNAAGREINLWAYYPVPITMNIDYHLIGADRIVYTQEGNHPNFDNTSSYKIFGYNDPVEWVICSLNGDPNWDNYPSLTDKNTLQPISNLPSQIPYCAIVAFSEGGDILYSQPLLMIKNTYAYDWVDNWDGTTLIDGYRVLSQMVGAGTVNESNQFSGVMMGQVGQDTSGASTGLYGFEDGALKFKFNDRGEAYIGNGSDNYIDFKEGNLSIAAENFNLESKGLTLNSNDGMIFKDKNDNIIFNLKPVKGESDATVTIAGNITMDSGIIKDRVNIGNRGQVIIASRDGEVLPNRSTVPETYLMDSTETFGLAFRVDQNKFDELRIGELDMGENNYIWIRKGQMNRWNSAAGLNFTNGGGAGISIPSSSSSSNTIELNADTIQFNADLIKIYNTDKDLYFGLDTNFAIRFKQTDALGNIINIICDSLYFNGKPIQTA